MGSLTSIESVARQLDESRQSTRLKSERVDFDSYMKAREQDIGNIKSASDFGDQLRDEFFGDPAARGLTLPWAKTFDKFIVSPGEITVWTGFNGHMKSMVLGHVMLDLMKQGQKACIASFEMKPKKTLRRMASQAIGTRHPTPAYVQKFLDFCTGKLWLYDQMGETSPERVLGVIYYCAEQLGVNQFVVDSLMKVIGDEDDFNGQKKFVGQLCAAAKDLNIHIHLVHHSRKRGDENTRPGKQDSKGTGAIVDQTDNFIAVFKTPRKDNEVTDAATHCLFIDKARHQEWEGAIALWFDETSLQFKEVQMMRVVPYVA